MIRNAIGKNKGRMYRFNNSVKEDIGNWGRF